MNTRFKNMVKSLSRGEILIPALRSFLAKENRLIKAGLLDRDAATLFDARMAVKTFQRRVEEFNHGVRSDVQFFHPSSIGNCLRQLWFKAKKAPKRDDPEEDLLRTHMIFETGTYVGVMFQNLCSRARLLIAREVAICNPKTRVLGHADGLLGIKQRRLTMELKTINDTQFSKLGDKPKDEHVSQTYAYMPEIGTDEGLIVYLEKNRHAIKEFHVPFVPKEYKRRVTDRISYYFDCIESNTIPRREGEHPREHPCRWCPYIVVCFSPWDLRNFKKATKAHEDKTKN
jgi:hypothetical protein